MSWRRRPEWSDWYEWESPKPRRPANGIKAQTQRGKFGATWWAGRWLAALEGLVDVNRLARGRSYARSGQVTKLEAGPKGVDARVQGSRPTPYKVTMRFRTLGDSEWDAVVGAMAGEALYAARLLSGEMPEQIEEAFQTAGVTLFPDDSEDLETDCTCPDWANPCKHVAAVFYLLGERFDADPFLMFELRGRTKEQVLDALRARRTTSSLVAETAEQSYASGEKEHAEEPEEEAPLFETVLPPGQASQDAVKAFWTVRADSANATDPLSLTFTFDAPSVDALPIKLLGAPPFVRDWPDFSHATEQAYRAIGEQALRLATEGAR